MEVTGEALGKVAGTAVNVIYAVFFVIVGALFTRIFSEALIISALPRTPISILTTGYIAMGLLGSYLGLESLARSTRVTYPFVVAGIAILLFSLIPQWETTQLYPILGTGPVNVFLKGGASAGIISDILMAAVIVQSLHDPGMFGKITARAMLMGFTYLTVLELILIMTTAWNASQEYTMPFYNLSRLIYLGRYFQRVESIFIIIWGFAGMVKIAITLYSAAVVLAGTFKLPDYRPLIWPLALMIFTASLIPPDMPSAIKLESIEYRQYYMSFSTIILPAVVLAADRLRMRGRRNEGG
ncbi:MAG: spore germination protein [Firmicutes bacterium]|nr:spore germination protein [Bacillota bacterium]